MGLELSETLAKRIKIIGKIFLFGGMAGFVLISITPYFLAHQIPNDFEWPAAIQSNVVFIDDKYYVPHMVGRLQVYDSDWRFERSWHVPNDGGVYWVEHGPAGSIQVRTARGNRLLRYSPEGKLKFEGTHSNHDETGVLTVVPTPYPLWVVAHPAGFWLIGALGMAMLGVVDKFRPEG